MSVLSRVNFVAQERLDLSALKAEQSFTAYDFRTLITFFSGSNKSYVVRGLEVVGKTGLTVSFSLADCLIFNPQDQNSSFFFGNTDTPNFALTLPADQPLVYVEAKFLTETGATVNAAFWDPISLVGGTASGSEFTAAADLEEKVVIQISANTVGFTEGALRLMTASTSASAILAMEDSRDLLFRLATGGETPDPLHKYPFSGTRSEPVPSGTGVGDAVDSPWRSKDTVGAINDKAFKSFKDWADAIMTRMAEISGSSIWYASGGSVAPVSDVSLNEVFFDTLGHSIEPSSNAAFKWQTLSGGLRLTSEGTIGGSSPYVEGLIKWQSNYTNLNWSLGGTFVAALDRNYSVERFQSPIPADGGNVYLLLEREVPKGSGGVVSWADNSAYTSFTSTRAVSGNLGDFTGIALNDYIRKQSEGYSKYYKVVKFSDGTVPGTYDNITDPNKVADSSIIALELENISDPSLGITSGVASEPLRYFRARYSDADVFADTTAGTYLYQSADYYWLGRRQGQLFFLRDYGTMQEGEEVTTLDATWAKGRQGGASDIIIKHADKSVYDPIAGYSLSSGAGDLITINRYKRNNTVSTPSAVDNSGALLSYTIAAPVGLMADGDALWVRLSDTTGGALVSGPVTNSTDDLDNTDVNTNHWQVRTAANTPPRTFDDKDVVLLARKFTLSGVAYMIFFDGSMLTEDGIWIDQSIVLQNDLFLKNKTQNSILFIGNTDGLVSEDPTNLFYDQSLNGGTFAAINFRFYTDTVNNRDHIEQAVERDVWAMTGANQKQFRIGGILTDVLIPGNLIVDGVTTSVGTANLLVQDKLITLGSGLLANTAQGAGVEVADDTKQALSAATTNGSPDVVLTFAAPHGYNINDVIGFNTNQDVGGLPAGLMSGEYMVVAVAGAAGDAVATSATVLTIRVSINATSTETFNYVNPTTYGESFVKPWSIQIAAADGSYSDRTSWSFKVKNRTTKPTITPVNGFQTVPTADATLFSNGRVPFAGNDNEGAAGSDSTLSFSASFSYDNTTSTLSSTNILVSNSGLFLGISTPSTPASNYTKIFASNSDHNMYQRTQDGNTALLTNIIGNVYNEYVDVVASGASGNNQANQISVPPQVITIPKDRRRYLGQGLLANTDGSTATVTVSKLSHGLTTGETVSVETATAIGGISAIDLSVINATVTVIDIDTFTYVAGAVSSSVATGNLDLVTAVSQKRYFVGDSELEIYRNGQLLQNGVHYQEVGSVGSLSSSIQFLIQTFANDVLTYRVDSNGGLFVRTSGGGGTSTLQDAYTAGDTILVSPGTPVSIVATNNTALSIDGSVNFANNVLLGAAPADGNISIFTQNFLVYQRTSDGNVNPVTNVSGNAYEENVTVVSSPSGNNQMAAIAVPPAIITIPKDTKKTIGSFLFASTDGSTATVTVKKIAHGLSPSDTVTVRTASTIGGIGPSNLSVTSVAISVIDANTFSYTAASVSSSVATGSLGSVYATTSRSYIVGSRELEIFRNGQKLISGVHYNEIGADESSSTQVQFLIVISLTDTITYRMDANGGNLFVAISGGGSGSLNDAYLLGNTISTSIAVPVIIGGSASTVLQINGNMAVTGLIL
jgi:hypothetical protein